MAAQALELAISLLLLMMAATLPFSLALVDARKGPWHVRILALVFGGLCYALGGPDFTAWMIAIFIAPAAAMAATFRFTPRVSWVFIAGVFTAVLCTFIYYAIGVVGANYSLADARALYLLAKESLREAVTLYGLPQANLNQLPGGPDRFFSYMVLYSPALGFLMESILLWLNILLVVRFSVGGKPYRGKKDLSEWSAVEPLVFGVLIPAVLMTVVRHRWNYVISGNILAVFMVPFFFQGMAITSHTLRRLRFSPGLRFVAYALLFGLFGFMVVPAQAAMGVLDIWMDFRRLHKPKNAEAEPTDQEGDIE